MTIVGIDLGTSYSSVSIIERGRPVVIPNRRGSRLTPSVVHILPSGEAVVGEPALQHRFLDPASTITGIKRLIGRRFNEVFDLARHSPYEIGIGDNNLAVVRVRDRQYTPQVISSLILAVLKSAAEEHLGYPVAQAVITVPVYFNEIQRQATREAAWLAGLETLRLVNEPTAACLAYGIGKREEETVLVFDLGGGTFDVSILEIGEGVAEVKATGGDGFLGGDDFDERIGEWLAEDFLARSGIDIAWGSSAGQRLRAAAVDAKHELALRHEVPVHIPFIAAAGDRRWDLDATLTPPIFAEITEELFQRLELPLKQALSDSGLQTSRLDHAVLVGGASRMPGIEDVVVRSLGKRPRRGINPDEAVALGAAVQAGVLGGLVKDQLLLDVTPASLSIETMGGLTTTLIARNTTIPTRKSEIFTTESDGQTSVEVHVVQGERPLARDNRSVGRLVLRDTGGRMSAGTVEVTLDIDANGLLNVSAKDHGTGRDAQARLVPWTGMTRAALADLQKQLPRISSS